MRNCLNDFKCPISQDIMEDPVMAADGYNYEKNYIQNWLKRKRTSPMIPSMNIKNKDLRPNRLLKSQINAWRSGGGGGSGGGGVEFQYY